LGGSWPSTLGWARAFCAIPIVIIVDASYKALRRSRSRELPLTSNQEAFNAEVVGGDYVNPPLPDCSS
jgi:hypothetical protein